MDVFMRFTAFLGGIPDWISFFLSPAFALVTFAVLWKKKSLGRFLPCCCVFAALGFTLLCCEGDVRYAFVWLGLFALYCAVLREIPRFCALFSRRRKKREERIYETFRLKNTGEEEPVRAERARPPKVDCFSDSAENGEEEADDLGELRLSHVQELLTRLRNAPLTAGDRLETDVLARSLDVYRNKKLTAAEVRSLNDCLASVLKLTAKYSL